MTPCPHRSGANCAAAARLAGLAAVTTRTDAACAVCAEQPQPPHGPNSVTASLAVAALREADPTAAAALLAKHRQLFRAARPPPLVTQLWTAAAALGRFLQSAAQLVDRETYAARLDVCQACGRRDNWRCTACGCVVEIKARLPHEHCPNNPPLW